MKTSLRSLFLAMLALAPVAASAEAAHPGDGRCSVTDMTAFDTFVGGKPTALEFRAASSCVTLVLPGDASSREWRVDNSRYFAELDGHGRIVGGMFR